MTQTTEPKYREFWIKEEFGTAFQNCPKGKSVHVIEKKALDDLQKKYDEQRTELQVYREALEKLNSDWNMCEPTALTISRQALEAGRKIREGGE